MVYAALIFSFLGALWWGLAAAHRPSAPVWVWPGGVLPSLGAVERRPGNPVAVGIAPTDFNRWHPLHLSFNMQVVDARPTGADVHRWVATATAAMPGLKVTGIALPWSDAEPVTVHGEWKAWLVRERTNAAYIDPTSGKLLGLRVAHQLGAGERLVHTADPLHFGNFAGLASKLIWLLFGILLTGLAVSGAMIHGQRVACGAKAGVGTAWRRSLGWVLLPTLILILAVPAWFFTHGWIG